MIGERGFRYLCWPVDQELSDSNPSWSRTFETGPSWYRFCFIYYSASVGVRSIVINPSVCASVRLSVREHISGTAGPTGTKLCVPILCGCDSVLLQRCCATLCTSGFMDDVTFGRNGRDAERWRLTRAATAMNDVAIPGRSLMSMNARC